MKPIGVIEGLFSYPVKSCRWLAHSEIHINELGLEGDRQYMLVDPEGMFLTQREIPLLSRITVKPSSKDILTTLDEEVGQFGLTKTVPFQKSITVWNDSISGALEHQDVSQWFSHILNRKVHFVEKPSSEDARIKFIPKTQETVGLSLVDGYPIHVVNISSIKDVESRIDKDISPMRFRPNLLISGLEAYAEEGLEAIHGQNFSLKIIKPAGRCAIPNIDPDNQSKGKEPMRTLATYKNKGNNVTFGIYATVLKTGKALLGEDLSLEFS